MIDWIEWAQRSQLRFLSLCPFFFSTVKRMTQGNSQSSLLGGPKKLIRWRVTEHNVANKQKRKMCNTVWEWTSLNYLPLSSSATINSYSYRRCASLSACTLAVGSSSRVHLARNWITEELGWGLFQALSTMGTCIRTSSFLLYLHYSLPVVLKRHLF